MFYLNFNKLTITVYTKKKLIMILEITITFLDFEDTYTRNLRPEIARKNKKKTFICIRKSSTHVHY